MSDIVERLRFLGSDEPFRGALMCEAADEIERMRAERRWNIEHDGEDLLVCHGDHEKSEKCDYARYKPAAMTDWVPVTERLPETAAACWVAIEMRYEVITRLAYCERSGNWQHIDARPILSPVLAWQPINKPEAYKP